MRKLVIRWIVWWHGRGAPNQHIFYRCLSCHHLVNWKMIQTGGCSCGRSKLAPTNLRFFEELRVVFAPWSVR